MQSRSSKKVEDINDAVNHRHERDGEGLKLYDLVCAAHDKTKLLMQWNQKQDIDCERHHEELLAMREYIEKLPCVTEQQAEGDCNQKE